MIRAQMNDELERICKEVVAAYSSFHTGIAWRRI
jgi:hypothetical protein